MLFHESVRDQLGLLLRVYLGPCGCEAGPEVQIVFQMAIYNHRNQKWSIEVLPHPALAIQHL